MMNLNKTIRYSKTGMANTNKRHSNIQIFEFSDKS